MKKQIIREYFDQDISIIYGKVEKVIERFQEMLDKGWTEIEIDTSEYCGGSCLIFSRDREETDKEYVKRLKVAAERRKKNREFKAQQLDEDRAPYKELKKRFENG